MKLRVNHSQLLFLSRGTSGNFQKEGTLRVGRRQKDLCERFCRLRGNLLFILKKRGGKLEEVLLLERCEVKKLPDDDRRLTVVFVGGDPAVFLESGGSVDAAAWLDALRRRVARLRSLVAAHGVVGGGHPEDTAERDDVVHQMFLSTRREQLLRWTGTGATVVLEPRHPAGFLQFEPQQQNEKQDVYKQTSFLGFTSFSIRDLLRSKEPRVSLSLRTLDGVNEAGEVKVSRLQMEGETPPDHECPALCDSLHGSFHDRENSPMMRAVLCAQVCKVYRFQTEDQRWLLVREQMSETPLSFSLPKQLLSALIRSHLARVQEVKELGDLSPHWDGLRHDVIAHCDHLIGCYQETLAELHKLSASSCFKSSSSKADKHLQFVPTNLHSQRMEVTDPHSSSSSGVWYEVITVGAPADHHQAFKHGGLKKLLSKHSTTDSPVSYSQDERSRARALLASVAQLQPLVFGLAEQLLAVSLELSASRLQQALDGLTQQTELFVHALKDELVKSALLEIHGQWRLPGGDGGGSSHVHSNGLLCEDTPTNQEGRRGEEYDEEEWDRVWVNVAMSLNCIVAMVDRLQGREGRRPLEVTSSELEVTSSGLEVTSSGLEVTSSGLEVTSSGLEVTSSGQEVTSSGQEVTSSGLEVTSSELEVTSSGLEVTSSELEVTSSGQEVTSSELEVTSSGLEVTSSGLEVTSSGLEVTSSGQQEANGDTNSQNTASSSPSSSSSSSASSWQEQLLPLVVTLRDCVREAMEKARAAMTFVVLQGAVATTVAQGPAYVAQRRHAVFSQALSAVVCGFLLKLYGGLEDPDFLLQLHAVGLLVQFEGLLSTYGDEVGMLEDMEVGVADLSGVAFTVTEAKGEQPDDLLPTLSGAWGSWVVEVPLPSETFGSLPQEVRGGRLIRVHPVLFNIGINQQQSLAERFGDSSLQERVNQQSCERLRAYCTALRDASPQMAGLQSLPVLLSSLDHSVETKKRKNVGVLWIAAMVCREVNGVRLTSCKSAKDRTAMSVTLEQCVLLRERHSLGQQHFSVALDCMRRSRLSWGQMLGCYSQSGVTVCGLDPGDRPPGLQGSWPPQCLAPEAPRRHLYPVAFLLVSSHLLVVWLILSLVILLAKYQDGCRMDNVQKNVGSRKFAFSGVQLLTFPKLYRPPDGSFG